MLKFVVVIFEHQSRNIALNLKNETLGADNLEKAFLINIISIMKCVTLPWSSPI